MSKSEPDPRDVESIDAIIAAAYDVISGPGDKKRDWNRERSLFFPGARVIPTASVPGRNDVDLEPQMLDVEGYIARVEPLLQQGFYEKEIARRISTRLKRCDTNEARLPKTAPDKDNCVVGQPFSTTRISIDLCLG